MNNDIVTRLREGLFHAEDGCGEYGCVTQESNLTNSDLLEAADEIERLRGAVATLSETRKVGSYTPEKPKDTIKRRAW